MQKFIGDTFTSVDCSIGGGGSA